MLLETYLLINQPVITDVIIDETMVCYQPDVDRPKKSGRSGSRFKEIV